MSVVRSAGEYQYCMPAEYQLASQLLKNERVEVRSVAQFCEFCSPESCWNCRQEAAQ